MQPARPVAVLDLVGHVDVGRLGLPVAGPGGVVAAFEAVVAELHFAGQVTRRRDVDDAGVEFGGRGCKHGVFDETEEEEMREVIGAELGFEPVDRFALRSSHDARVIDQGVESVALAQEGLGGRADAGEGVVVHFQEFDAAGLEEGFAGRFSLFEVASGEEDFASCGG